METRKGGGGRFGNAASCFGDWFRRDLSRGWTTRAAGLDEKTRKG